MEADHFHLLVKIISGSEKERWPFVRTHLGNLISRWAKDERFELEWIASKNGLGEPESVIDEIFSKFRTEILSGNAAVDSYQTYKKVLFKVADEVMEDQFVWFYSYFARNDQMAWKKVNERLQLYCARWLSNRNIEAEMAREIYQDSILTLVEKVNRKRPGFKTSRELKSYFFRIVELKTYEYRRRQGLKSKRSKEMMQNPMWEILEKESYEADDRYHLVEKIMSNSIPEEEKYILKHYYFHGEKLSDIARFLGISDTNCRQKKHQALRKIAEAFRANTSQNEM